MCKIKFSVFTKPWKYESVDEVGRFISGIGFDAIEFPLRAGYQVEPENAEKGLPMLVRQLKKYGLEVASVASSACEPVFIGCANAGIPLIRIMLDIDLDKGFMRSLDIIKRQIEGFLPLCVKYGVKVGIQHHFGPMISNSMELFHVVSAYEPEYVAAIWDSAHSSLAGEEPEQGLSILWRNLCMINLKNAYYVRVNGPEAETAEWERYFTTGRHGLASWPRIINYLKKNEYNGTICLSAEYTAEDEVNRLIVQDLEYVRSLF